MAITIHIGSGFDDMQNNPSVIFWRTLIYYFATFDEGAAISALARVPFHDDKSFDLQFCRRLNTELPELISRASRDELPGIPIAMDEEDGDDEFMDSTDVLEFLKALLIIVSAALETGRPIVSIGD
jgi:hypothetical protein